MVSVARSYNLGRKLAFTISFWFWLPCGLLCIACGWTMPGDEVGGRTDLVDPHYYINPQPHMAWFQLSPIKNKLTM